MAERERNMMQLQRNARERRGSFNAISGPSHTLPTRCTVTDAVERQPTELQNEPSRVLNELVAVDWLAASGQGWEDEARPRGAQNYLLSWVFMETRLRLRSARLRSFLLGCACLAVVGFTGCADPAAPVNQGRDPANVTDDGDTGSDDSTDDDGTAKVDAGKGTPNKVDAGKALDAGKVVDAGKGDPGAVDAGALTPTVADAGKKPDAQVTTVDAPGDASTNASDGGKAGAAHADLGKGDGSDVITIGDSWMQYALNGGGIERGLKDASGQKYRNYGVTGVELLKSNTFGPAIPTQYAAAKKANPKITTVVMTGGGNDLLMLAAGDTNAKIDEVSARLAELWKEMAADGVQDVVYFEYSRGGKSTNKPQVEYAETMVRPACENAPLRCHFIDSDTIIHMEILALDGLGVHPTQDGCTKLGKGAFDLMVSEGMRR
jgi:hypothetical protein